MLMMAVWFRMKV